MFTPTAIERLYFEHEDETWGDSPESKAAFDRCGAEFRKYNPEPTLDEENGIDDAISNYGAIERREGFVDGFKPAVQLMSEVLYTANTTDRGGTRT